MSFFAMEDCTSENPITKSGFNAKILSILALTKVEIIGFSFFARLGLTVKLDIPTILSCFPNLYKSSVVSSVKQTILCGPLR